MATYGLFTAGKMVTMLMSWDQARDSPAAINDDFVIHHLHSTLPLILTVLSKLDRGIQLEMWPLKRGLGRGSKLYLPPPPPAFADALVTIATTIISVIIFWPNLTQNV